MRKKTDILEDICYIYVGRLILHYSHLTSSLHSACLAPYSLVILQTYCPSSDLCAELILISVVPSSVSRTAKRPAVFTETPSFNLGQNKVAVTVVYTQVLNGGCVTGKQSVTLAEMIASMKMYLRKDVLPIHHGFGLPCDLS